MDLLEQADALDAQKQHQRAAELRVQALGSKPYPVLICSGCAVVTGWLGSDGTCVMCWTHRRLHESNSFAGVAAPASSGGDAPLVRRMKRTLGLGTKRDRAREWLEHIDPDQTGAIEPEEGWETVSPLKWDEAAPEGPHRVVRFAAQPLRFDAGAWRACETARHGMPRRLVPREFPAALPIEQLAEAWNDFEQELVDHNRNAWQQEAASRGIDTRPPDEEHGVADLLG